MLFDLNNLQTLDDYTNAGKHFISLYNPILLKNDDAIHISVYSVYKAKIKLDKTQSIHRYNYTRKSVFNALTNLINRMPKNYSIPDYIKIDTPLETLIKKEKSLDIQDFILFLTNKERVCAYLLCDGYNNIEISQQMNVSRQRINQLIKKIRKKYGLYVLEKEKK
jgi:RNA polymerase sigma factor (sigma-70 family)